MGFTALLDAPAKPTKRYQIAKLGEFKDGRYGEFSITEDEVASWRKNLELLPDGKALIDFDHKSLRTPRDSRAAGWITGVHRDGEKVMADIDWTPAGEQAIKDGEYQFFSPVYGDFADETGATHESTLSAGALTNVPFLGSMPALALASEQRMEEALKVLEADDEQHTRLLETLTTTARNNLKSSDFVFPSDRRYPIHDESHAKNALARSSGKPEESTVKAAVYKRYPSLKPSSKAADSRSPMDVKVLETLGLAEDAPDADVVEAVTALQAKALAAAEPPEVKTLDEQAKAEGKVLLDQAEVTQLKADAAKGAQASGELAEAKFETAFQRALDRGKAVPAQKELKQHYYGLDPASVLKELEEGPQLVNVTPQGAAIEMPPDFVQAPPGVAQEGFDVDRAVKERMKELGKDPRTDYQEVWELVQAERNGDLA